MKAAGLHCGVQWDPPIFIWPVEWGVCIEQPADAVNTAVCACLNKRVLLRHRAWVSIMVEKLLKDERVAMAGRTSQWAPVAANVRSVRVGTSLEQRTHSDLVAVVRRVHEFVFVDAARHRVHR